MSTEAETESAVRSVARNGASAAGQTLRRTFTPPIDVYENADEILVIADLPGVSPNDVSVVFDNDIVTLSASRGAGASYERILHVPSGIDADAVSANAKNGTVTIHLPKSERAKRRQIRVDAG